MQATDALLYNREAICAIAAKHGLIASFVPKLSASTAGSGAHLHLSIWKVPPCQLLAAKGYSSRTQPILFDLHNGAAPFLVIHLHVDVCEELFDDAYVGAAGML